MKISRQNTLSICAGICIAFTAYAFFIREGKAKQQDTKKPYVTSLPSISSCTNDITVENAFFRNPEDGELVLQIRNNTDVSVAAISIESSSKKDHAVFRNVTNSFESDKPTPVINPHRSAEFTMERQNIREDSLIKVGSVVFADGREAGCKHSLKVMHDTKAFSERVKDEKKS